MLHSLNVSGDDASHRTSPTSDSPSLSASASIDAGSREYDAYYGLGSVVFLVALLGCAMSGSGMCRHKKRNPFVGSSTFFDEDRFLPRRRRLTVPQIVDRNTRFLDRLSAEGEQRQQRAAVADDSRFARPDYLDAFVHVPDILNPVTPSVSHEDTRNAPGLQGRSECSDDLIPGGAFDRSKWMTRAKERSAREWESFQTKLGDKMKRFARDFRRERRRISRPERKRTRTITTTKRTYSALTQDGSDSSISTEEEELIDDDRFPFL